MSVVPPPELDDAAVVAALVGGEPQPIVEAAVAKAPGFYAWWARPERLVDATPPIPAAHPPGASDEWALLNVGIAAKRDVSVEQRCEIDRALLAEIVRSKEVVHQRAERLNKTSPEIMSNGSLVEIEAAARRR